MNIKEMKELIDIVDKSNLTAFEYENSGVKLVLKKEVNVVAAPVHAPVMPAVQAKTIELKEEKNENNKLENNDEDKDLQDITSPIVGTYYEAPSPDSKPFVSVGDKIKKGQTVCIVEAMKLMNELTADFDCEVVKILVKNEQVVQYGQPILKVRAI